MSLWQRLRTFLCPAVKRPAPQWFWSGKVGFEFGEGEGTWPTDMLLAGKLKDMVYDGKADNSWPELKNPGKYYGHLWDGEVVWEIRRAAPHRYFVWGIPKAAYGKDGHPHPNAGAFWLDSGALNNLWKAINAHRRGRADKHYAKSA